MTALVLAAAAAMVPAAGSELVVRGAKLQTRMARVLAVWTAAYMGMLIAVLYHAGVDVVAVTIFWAGAFLVWFGARSHIESSILLRMLVLLRARGMTDAHLVQQYLSTCGPSARLSELRRAGLVDDGDPAHVTPKGEAILRVVSRLR